jgi:hypothetical protein
VLPAKRLRDEDDAWGTGYYARWPGQVSSYLARQPSGSPRAYQA